MVKPVILAVDDDPEVLGAVERDLRSHYRSDYRILKAVVRRRGARGRPPAQAARHARRALPRGRADAGHDGHGVPARGDQAPPGLAEGPAHRLRRHAGRDLRHQRRRAGPLPAEAVGSSGGAALSGPRRPPVGLDGARAPSLRGHPGRGRPVVAAQLRGQGVPVAQPDPLPVDRRRPGRADARADPLVRRPRRSFPVVLFPDGSRLVAPTNRELAEKVGNADAGDPALLRPR